MPQSQIKKKASVEQVEIKKKNMKLYMNNLHLLYNVIMKSKINFFEADG